MLIKSLFFNICLTVELACGTPNDGSHSIWNGTKFGPGDTVMYTCNTGYKVVGSVLNNTLICNSNGEWSNQPLNCIGMYVLNSCNSNHPIGVVGSLLTFTQWSPSNLINSSKCQDGKLHL